MKELEGVILCHNLNDLNYFPFKTVYGHNITYIYSSSNLHLLSLSIKNPY